VRNLTMIDLARHRLRTIQHNNAKIGPAPISKID
jgi:hypothetical protein